MQPSRHGMSLDSCHNACNARVAAPVWIPTSRAPCCRSLRAVQAGLHDSFVPKTGHMMHLMVAPCIRRASPQNGIAAHVAACLPVGFYTMGIRVDRPGVYIPGSKSVVHRFVVATLLASACSYSMDVQCTTIA